jgi:hypothetical protein
MPDYDPLASHSTIVVIDWPTLKAVWLGLTLMFENYDWRGTGKDTLIEARRIVEIEMREQGYEKRLERLRDD